MTILIGIIVYMAVVTAATQACWWLSNKTCDWWLSKKTGDYLDGLHND